MSTCLASGSLVCVAAQGLASFALPPLFLLVVLLFARQGGAVSRLLLMRPFLLLGTLSYSIYMDHFLIAKLVGGVIPKLIRRSGSPHPLLLGDIAALALVALPVAVAWLTYRAVERPAQRLLRGWIERRLGPRVGLRPAAAAASASPAVAE